MMCDYTFFNAGVADAYKYMGCHREDEKHFSFAVWAPCAKSVHLVGDFNNWDTRACPMTNRYGVWTVIAEAQAGQQYKLFITSPWGESFYKADPYAFFSQTRGRTNSIIYESSHEWGDAAYLAKKERRIKKAGGVFSLPMNIYEVNLSAWRRRADGGDYSYDELAATLVPYVKKMDYTHVEIMPLTEYPFDGSWGYQATGYFSPTARCGEPDGLRRLVEAFHKADIGVILDFVPAHFCKDAFGLIEFDGTPCYEYSDPKKAEHKNWGTRVFDFGRPQVRSFLMSSALYFLNEFHFDGLRIDAVASMLYLDYDRKEGQYCRNIYGGKENLEAIAFLRQLSREIFAAQPSALLIAEESTAFGGVTQPADAGGLGFNFKWNMGWMNDVLAYCKKELWAKKYHHNNLTFAMTYAYSENYILPFSHDEVVHGKGAMIEKTPALYNQKFAALRVLLMFQFAHPGKKLNFMGCEIAQFNEFCEFKELDWFLLKHTMHKKFHAFVRALNAFYKRCEPLFEQDCASGGFVWRVVDDNSGVLVMERSAKNGKKLLAVINFSDYSRQNYKFVGENGRYVPVLNSDEARFGGSGEILDDCLEITNGTAIIKLIPAISAQYFEFYGEFRPDVKFRQI